MFFSNGGILGCEIDITSLQGFKVDRCIYFNRTNIITGIYYRLKYFLLNIRPNLYSDQMDTGSFKMSPISSGRGGGNVRMLLSGSNVMQTAKQ